MSMLLYYLKPLVIALLTELITLYLLVNKKVIKVNNKDIPMLYLVAILIICTTNIVLNNILLIFSLSSNIIALIIGQIIVTLIHAYLFYLYFDKKEFKKWLIVSIIVNFIAFIIGLLFR